MELRNDEMCFACGKRNPIGLKLEFGFDGQELSLKFTPRKEHQGWADIVHGGILSTLLDEAMAQLTIAMGKPTVTAKMTVEFKRPALVGEELCVTARLSNEKGRVLEVTAEAVHSEGGEIVARAEGTLIRKTLAGEAEKR
ncbi:MAG: PaaI family thioesterase [bacterium]